MARQTAAVAPSVRYAFVVPGNPLPKERPRVVGRRAYTGRRTLEAEERVRLAALGARVKRIDGTVRLRVRFYRDSAQPADLDNLVKLVSDALNGIAYEDDRQIVWLSASKEIDRECPRTEVEIERAP